ncbi:MAG: hypothetical protein AB7N76_30125 [Planctomycetota bacterium]
MTPRVRAGLLALLMASGAGLAHAQQSPDSPTPPQPQADQAELERLRKAADSELEGDATQGGGGSANGKPLDDSARLRKDADRFVEEEDDPLQQQLLDAFTSIANRLNAFNPRLTVIGDVLGRLSGSSRQFVQDGQNKDDRIALREMELDLRADIDPYSKGVLVLSAEEVSNGQYELGIEEGYITLETLPLGFRGRIGKFRMPFGRVNALHTHDLPQAYLPYALTNVFGEEGLADTGAELTWLMPWAPLELRAVVLNGENDAIFAGGGSNDPAYLTRAEYFIQIDQTMFLSLGSSFLFGFNDARDDGLDRPKRSIQESQVWGADLLFKWQPNQFHSVVFQTEAYGVKKELAGRQVDRGYGAYAFLQVQPFQRWFFGARYDWSTFQGGAEGRDEWAASAYVSYYTTEFLRFRLGYEHRTRSTSKGGEPDLHTVYFQLTFVFGSHPVEPFWVNR